MKQSDKSTKKTGRLSKKEWRYIEEQADLLTPEQIAINLGRDLEAIQKRLAQIGKTEKPEALEVQAEYDLKSRLYWKEIKAQCTPEEQELFLYHWGKIVSQFRKDILATEELQIVHLIQLEILINRNLKSRHEISHKITDIKKDILRLQKEDPVDVVAIELLKQQEVLLTQSAIALTTEYKELQNKNSTIFKDLKATREQRIKDIENSKETFSGLLVKIAKDPDFRRTVNLEMERMRLAMEVEQQKLGDYHTFDDGEIDQPFLNADTVL